MMLEPVDAVLPEESRMSAGGFMVRFGGRFGSRGLVGREHF